MPYLKKPIRRAYLPPKERLPTGDQKFINSKAWRQATTAYRKANPLCEVCQAVGLVVPSDVTDHIVARSFGGALLDARNLMAMCSHHHDCKSGIETRGSFVRTRLGPLGLVPEDRQQVIDRLTNRVPGEGLT